jgi:predicted RNA-binding protein with PUA-like domain
MPQDGTLSLDEGHLRNARGDYFVMKSWIFQARPDQYDIRERLHVGDEVPWYATRFAREMEKGDRVFFWLAGSSDIRGIYARGHVSGATYDDENGTPRIPVQVDEILPHPVSVAEIRRSPALKDLGILRVPIGTNFKLQDEEAEGITRLFDGALQSDET